MVLSIMGFNAKSKTMVKLAKIAIIDGVINNEI